MRVTQSMLSNNMLRNLSNSYNNMGKLQEQINTGKRVNRPSDDPVSVMKSLGYGMTVDKVGQYQKNLGEVNNWLDSTDDALDGVGDVLQRAKELATNASNTGSMTKEDRDKIKIELDQMQQQLHDLANTKVGDKYIFSGTNTDTPLYAEGAYSSASGINSEVNIEVFDGVSLRVNTKALESFSEIDKIFNDIKKKVDNSEDYDDTVEFGPIISRIEKEFDKVLTNRADVGARSNRAELMKNRLEMQEGAAKKQRSENEDVDYEVAITELITSESIHRAALSVGARIIQPSLVDFLR
ncbi:MULTISPECIES: flagellar hook-associated protein FlgL [unclassified Sporosarcina]|uniref:flagellar hook-associated protein FlgL n=1 Tax=unclassified Sporosarcina TaxID=2647733 RepID=UPI00203E6188|nr:MULTISPECIES: flagellar hook-associated protein FlgL [unclassified Sporosarcina]GKV64867.1 flagellar hook-associated protein 3 [Sporosarcina sp. NCCP-2331]GLB54977.1 flagellar hook-associated protein 3 [Sporosarcina sp. NCCP-2378]